MTSQEITSFRAIIYNFYTAHRRDFPWRKTNDPYHILVSEIMLQQTQTDRVVPKFIHFIETFPTVKSLANAPLQKVLQEWQGLGYNRRGLMLHKTACAIIKDHAGNVPRNEEVLKSLPGIGPYTAAAIAAFAYNTPAVVIETNIRAVFIHHFFRDTNTVYDKELLPLIEQTLDAKNPRQWYSALMDYGAYLKKEFPNPSRKSVRHAVQSKFAGSDRQIRGAIIRALTQKNISKQALSKILAPYNPSPERLETILKKLLHESMIIQRKNMFSLNDG